MDAISDAIATLMRAGVIAATIAQAGATRNQEGGLSNIQRFKVRLSPALKGGGDPVVTSHCSRLVEKDAGASRRRKESQNSSSSRKRQKTYASHGP